MPACGGDGETGQTAERDAAKLTIRFTHPREHTVRYRCARCDPRRLSALASALRDSARRDRACTELYGGPHRAFVTGTLRGERVSARFSRVDGCAIAAYDSLLRALGRPPALDDTRSADPGRVAVPETDGTPPMARIVLASAGDGRPLAEASQPPGHAVAETVELPEARLRGTGVAVDSDGGVARVRVSIRERITCRPADAAPVVRRRTRYFPPPQIERIRSTPGTRLPATRTRSLPLELAVGRCGANPPGVEIHGELWGEAINGSGLEAVTPHIRFVYRQG